MPIGGNLLGDRVTLVKEDGTIFKSDVPASVQVKKIFINDVTLPVEIGDHILRSLPSNLQEDFIVTAATCYTGSLSHWEISYRRSNTPLSPTQTIINNISGHNARVNINSTDNSINKSTTNTHKVISDIIDALNSKVSDDSERTKLVALVEEIQESGDKKTVLAKYQNFITAAANHMTVIAPFIPALSQLL